MEIIAQAVRVIDYENNSVQRRNVNMMPKFKDYIEQLIVHVSNNVSIREYHTQSTRTEVIAGCAQNVIIRSTAVIGAAMRSHGR